MNNLRSQIEPVVAARCAQAGAVLSLPTPLPRGVKWAARALGRVRQTVTAERFGQFLRFCLVGVSGTGVDMVLLFLLADSKTLGWNIAVSKVCAAEIALLNNFLWNELWTFKQPSTFAHRLGDGRGAGSPSLAHRMGEGRGEGGSGFSPRLRRFLLFNAICGVGIGLAVALLHFFHTWLGFNLYLANLLTISVVTLWNFGMNAKFNWVVEANPEKTRRRRQHRNAERE